MPTQTPATPSKRLNTRPFWILSLPICPDAKITPERIIRI